MQPSEFEHISFGILTPWFLEKIDKIMSIAENAIILVPASSTDLLFTNDTDNTGIVLGLIRFALFSFQRKGW